ncbi:MAG: hypothetical protein HRU30_18865, partial [Rhodobacteraceae bacterium]|nr:hypothetical protein [Paracoccaceae bacterium]
AETSAPPAQDTAADEPPAEQEAPKPRVVHVEDEPDTLDDVSPSLLSHISRLRSVPAEHKSQVAALVKDLSAVRDRMAGARQARKD